MFSASLRSSRAGRFPRTLNVCCIDPRLAFVFGRLFRKTAVPAGTIVMVETPAIVRRRPGAVSQMVHSIFAALSRPPEVQCDWSPSIVVQLT